MQLQTQKIFVHLPRTLKRPHPFLSAKKDKKISKKPSEAWVFDGAYLEMREVKVGKSTLVLLA